MLLAYSRLHSLSRNPRPALRGRRRTHETKILAVQLSNQRNLRTDLLLPFHGPPTIIPHSLTYLSMFQKDLSQRRTIRRPNQARQHPTNLRGSLAHLALGPASLNKKGQGPRPLQYMSTSLHAMAGSTAIAARKASASLGVQGLCLDT